MGKVSKYGRRYAYKVRHKYRQDPFAFLILWALFLSAIFLIFAFRGLIAVNFMKKIDLSPVASEDLSSTSIIEDVASTNNSN
ncbi:hypothetical protein KKE14_00340 [Patescibacteria group bacterium]|nr:hypothetical protein [Patescibacteria group bacterium]